MGVALPIVNTLTVPYQVAKTLDSRVVRRLEQVKEFQVQNI